MSGGSSSSPPGGGPLVSVVLPVLDEALFIDRCLASVLDQDYPRDRLEVLVLDGGSRDDTPARVAAFAKDHPQVRLLANPGRTQAKAFNLGVRQARGDVIVRMDAHAEYDPSYLRLCVQTLEETGAANVGGVWNTAPGGAGLLARAIAVAYSERFGAGGARFRVGGQAGPVDTVPFGAFRRDVLERVGGMDERLPRGEDNEFNGRLRSAGLTVYFDPRIVCTYYARASLRAFLGQMFANGLYHVPTLLVNRRGLSPRHLAPAAFVLVLLAGAALGFVWSPVWWAAAAMMGAYLLADAAASLSAAARRGWVYAAVLPWLFLLMHLAYGMGTLAGVFRSGVPALWGGVLGRRTR